MTAGAVPIHRRAVASLGLGLLGFVLLVVAPFASLVLSLPSLTTGIHARREIADSAGAVRGHDLAGYGIVVGAATMGLAVVAIVIDLLFDR